jgi:hypothetical protein
MKFLKLRKLLESYRFISITEGGNVFKDEYNTTRIKKADVIPTVQFLEEILNTELVENMVGTTGKVETSGDIDILLDENIISKNDLIDRLSIYLKKEGLEPDKNNIAKTGISVHFRCPIISNGKPTGEYVQVDFMFPGSGGIDFGKFILQGEKPNKLGIRDGQPAELKAKHRQIILSKLAKDRGYTWNAFVGLKTRSEDKKIKSTIVTADPDEAARLLFDTQDATKEDLVSIERIFKILKRTKSDEEIKEMFADINEQFKKEDNIEILFPLTEATAEGSRVGISHLYSLNKPELYSMDFNTFKTFINILDKNNGIISPTNANVSEKADGMALKVGLLNNEFYMQSSYSGMVFNKEEFKTKIKYPPVIDAFVNNFDKFKILLEPVLSKHTDENGNIMVQCEWLYSPLAEPSPTREGFVTFQKTEYDVNKLAKHSTIVIIKTEPSSKLDIIEKELVDLSTEEIKFVSSKIPTFENINLQGFLNKCKNAINYLETTLDLDFLSSKQRDRASINKRKEIKEEIAKTLLPIQKEMYEKILDGILKIDGRLGDTEGYVIKAQADNEEIMFKVNNPKFMASKFKIG